ncbi:hypothetical protein DFH09DRAFT_1355907 [Mycena vulgaris]|nr:hypothetical protein DFH09DRAFT_1355907 [Mycena vulgaris]
MSHRAYTFDFPRPPCAEESSGSGSGSGSDSSSLSSPATTSSPSPTTTAHSVLSLTRCKSIKLLTITKRIVSPVLPPAESAAQPESAREQGDELWEDYDEFYAVHASTFITLATPLPPSFPVSSLTPATHTNPHHASVRPTAQSPSPRAHRHIAPPSFPHPSLAVPPSCPLPRIPIPSDAQNGDYTVLAAPLSRLLLSPRVPRHLRRPPSRPRARARITWQPSSPPHPRQFIAAPYGVLSEVDDEWEEYEYEHAYDDVPVSPLVAPAPTSSSPRRSRRRPMPMTTRSSWRTFPPRPPHIRTPALTSSRGPSSARSAPAGPPPRSPPCTPPTHTRTPEDVRVRAAVLPLRFAREGWREARWYSSRVGKKAAGKGKGKRLTAADVRVLGLGSAIPSSSSSSSTSPAFTSSPSAPSTASAFFLALSAESKTSPSCASTFKSLLALQTPATAQFASYPYPLPLALRLRRVPTLDRALRSLHDAALLAPTRLHRLLFRALLFALRLVCVEFRAVGERALGVQRRKWRGAEEEADSGGVVLKTRLSLVLLSAMVFIHNFFRFVFRRSFCNCIIHTYVTA